MALSDIVKVDISRETTGVTKAGFGTLMIVGESNIIPISERVRIYSSFNAVSADFPSASLEYKSAQLAFSGELKPARIMIGRKLVTAAATSGTMTTALSNTTITGWKAITDGEFSIDVDGVTEEVTGIDFSAATSYDDIASILQTDLRAVTLATETVTYDSVNKKYVFTSSTTGVTSVVDNLAEVAVPAGTNLVVSGLLVQESKQDGEDATTEENIVDAITAISAINDDWYALSTTLNDNLTISQVAGYIEARRKLYFVYSGEAGIIDSAVTNDIASELKNSNFFRTILVYNESTQDAGSAYAGQNLPYDPGSITWKFKTLNAVTVSDLSDTQRNAAKNKNSNIFVANGGVNMTEEGKVSGGEFIDIMRGVDWLQARLEENIFLTLVNARKVPYTTQGLGDIENAMAQVLELAIRRGVLSSYTITMPKLDEILPNDKIARILPDVKFEGILAGAIHFVLVQGVVKV